MNLLKFAFKTKKTSPQSDVAQARPRNDMSPRVGNSGRLSMFDPDSPRDPELFNTEYASSQPDLRHLAPKSNFDPSIILPSIVNINADQNPTPDECVQQALQLHEKGNLEEATNLLKIAASQNHPLGLFLLGISLRHGWGCEIDSLLAFQCLQHSAESAIFDLNSIKKTDCSVAKHELTIAIHELGICFSHGWGVSRNKETAAYYFELAANLGDPDSQNELGHCYLYGVGVKRDKIKAAHYFRMAHDQGVGLVGNSWIFKEKYNSPPV